MAQSKSTRELVIAAVTRRTKPEKRTARELAQAIMREGHLDPSKKYALENARKVIYRMHRDGELDRAEDGSYSLPTES